jgi:hypothetical protein
VSSSVKLVLRLSLSSTKRMVADLRGLGIEKLLTSFTAICRFTQGKDLNKREADVYLITILVIRGQRARGGVYLPLAGGPLAGAGLFSLTTFFGHKPILRPIGTVILSASLCVSLAMADFRPEHESRR